MPFDTTTSARDPIAASRIVSKRFEMLSAAELHAILRLRCQVFVVEQGCAYADVDGMDELGGTTHHWIVVDGVLAAYARVVRGTRTSRIGRVVTHPDHRGRGLARRLVIHIRDSVSGELTLEAQTPLVEWYRDVGFEVSGPEYVEDGIPHVPMIRSS